MYGYGGWLGKALLAKPQMPVESHNTVGIPVPQLDRQASPILVVFLLDQLETSASGMQGPVGSGRTSQACYKVSYLQLQFFWEPLNTTALL